MEILYRILEYINYFFIGVASIGFIFQVVYILFIWLRPKHFPEAKTLRKFGIVIAAHNEEEVIGHTVRYMLEKLNYPKDRYDLFVVCHNCTDNTAKVAREAGANIVILEDPDPSHAMEAYPVARGVQELIARGGYDIFVRFDADNLPHPDYLRKMNDAFETGVEIARGFEASTNLKQNNWTKVSGTYYIRDSRIACNFRERAHLDSMLTGAGLTCSMKILEEIGGWDAFETSEDVDFTFRRMIEGKRIHYVADAILYEDQPSTLKDNYARLTRMGNGLNKMFWKKGWAFLGHFFTTGRFSFIDLFMQVFFIPVALVCCLWFPAYYIFYCIVNLINAFGPAFMGSFITPQESIASLIQLGLLVLYVVATYYIGYALQTFLAVVLSKKTLGIKSLKGYWAGIFLSPAFMVVWAVCISIGILTKAGWKKVGRNVQTEVPVLEDKTKDRENKE